MNKYYRCLIWGAIFIFVFACGQKDEAVDITNEYIEQTENQMGAFSNPPYLVSFPFIVNCWRIPAVISK